MSTDNQEFTQEELVNAVTFGNVQSFYDHSTISNSSDSSIASDSSTNSEQPVNASLILSNRQRADALASDPFFPAKCRAFRNQSAKHASIFFDWIEGNDSIKLTEELGISPKQTTTKITLGRYIRRKHYNKADGSISNNNRAPLGNNTTCNTSKVHTVNRRLKMEKKSHSRSWTQGEVDYKENNKKWQKEVASLARSMVLNSSITSITSTASIQQTKSGRRSRRSKRRSKTSSSSSTTTKGVRKLLKIATPRKISSRRRKALANALVDFGVEKKEDLNQFTYAELRNERSL